MGIAPDAFQPIRPTGIVASPLYGHVDKTLGERDGYPVFHRSDAGQIGRIGLDQRGKLLENFTTPLRVCVAPSREGGFRCGNRFVNGRGARQGNVIKSSASRWVNLRMRADDMVAYQIATDDGARLGQLGRSRRMALFQGWHPGNLR